MQSERDTVRQPKQKQLAQSEDGTEPDNHNKVARMCNGSCFSPPLQG